MTNYRDFVESKLADIDRRRADIESERERLLTTLGVLDEADSSQGDKSRPVVNAATADVPVPVAIVNHLITAGRTMTTAELNDLLSQRSVTRPHMHSALYRLKNRGITFKAGKNMWGLVGRDDRTTDGLSG